MKLNRGSLLCGAAGLIAVYLLWQWVAGWGLITADLTNQPLSKAIKTIERQGGVNIVTNADLNLPITLQVDKVPVMEAFEIVAAQLDADARVAYIAAPDKGKVKEVLAAFESNTNPGGWEVFSPGFGGGMSFAEVLVDPRTVDWNVSEMEDHSIQAIYGQGAQKTGALFATPKDWNPVLGRLPASGKTKTVAAKVAKGGKGYVEEVFLLTTRPPRSEEGGRGGGGWDRTVFAPRFQRGGGNPEWIAERAQNEISKLPPAEKADAQKLFDEFRALMAANKDLTEEERRAKMQEFFSKPEVQEAMENRMAARDARKTPEQRVARYKRYIDRKTQATGQAPRAPQS